ncbi:MAG: MFS transporter [Saprospiraceae bacterium]|nr:MFS transporter [Saprospiraceae bacterium]
MSFGFLGIQFGWGLQMANMSSIYRYLDAKPDELPLLWLAAPLTGLIIQPIIGYMSDRTWNGLGRRKPYFLTGAILASICLVLMPNSSALWMAAGLLWILDASINVSMEPFRAFVGDMLPAKQHTQGFTMQSFFIGLGSVIASALPFLLRNVFGMVPNENEAIPANVRISFYLGAAAFFGAVIYTILKVKEYPPADMEAFRRMKAKSGNAISATIEGFGEIISNIKHMPKVMRQLTIVQFFTWMGLFLMWFFFGDATATYIFQAPGPESDLYKQGSEWSGLMFAVYSGVTFLVAFLLAPLAERITKPKAHALCLTLGGLGLLLMGVFTSKYHLIISMIGIGIAWASTVSMPYAIFARHLPPGKLGVYMGIFNFFIVIPEILATLFFGYILKHFLGSNTLYAVMLAGAMLLLAAGLALRVKDDGEA